MTNTFLRLSLETHVMELQIELMKFGFLLRLTSPRPLWDLLLHLLLIFPRINPSTTVRASFATINAGMNSFGGSFHSWKSTSFLKLFISSVSISCSIVLQVLESKWGQAYSDLISPLWISNILKELQFLPRTLRNRHIRMNAFSSGISLSQSLYILTEIHFSSWQFATISPKLNPFSSNTCKTSTLYKKHTPQMEYKDHKVLWLHWNWKVNKI